MVVCATRSDARFSAIPAIRVMPRDGQQSFDFLSLNCGLQ
jgi:hypothetical protein